MAVNDQPRLGCGRLIDDVWDGLGHPPDGHEQSCPFCQQARSSLLDLSEATDALAAYEQQSPDYTPGVHVKDVVMELVHVEVRRASAIPLRTPVAGAAPNLVISEQAVLDVIWRAADTLPGLRARHCAVRLHPGDQEPGLPAVVDVEIDIAVTAGLSIPQVTAALRAHLQAMVTEETGLVARQITVTVEDLYDA